jgi:hypothetical protein
MRITIISLIVTFLMMGKTCAYMDVCAQKLSFCHQIEFKTDSSQSSIEDSRHFISESSQWFPIAGEKPVFSYNIISIIRQLPENISFKEFHIRHILKNRLFLLDTVVNVCHSLKLYHRYYTLGLGKLRC